MYHNIIDCPQTFRRNDTSYTWACAQPAGDGNFSTFTARNADRCNSQWLSVRLSVRHVPVFCPLQTNEDTIVRSSVSGRTIMLVSGEVKLLSDCCSGVTQLGHYSTRHC